MKIIKHNYTGKSLLELRDEFSTGKAGFYNANWWIDESFAKEHPPRREYEIIFRPDWNNMTYEEQLDKMGNEEFLHPAILAEAILTHFRKTGERLMKNWWTRTSSVGSDGLRVHVGAFASDGLDVYRCWDDRRGDGVGVSSARKLSTLPEELEINGVRYKRK